MLFIFALIYSYSMGCQNNVMFVIWCPIDVVVHKRGFTVSTTENLEYFILAGFIIIHGILALCKMCQPSRMA